MGNYLIHQEEMAQRAQEDEHMEDLVAAEAGVVPARPLHRVQHAAHGVQYAAQYLGSSRTRGTMAARDSQPITR